jgi:hypothetical protein
MRFIIYIFDNIQNKSFRSDFSQFHKISIFKSQNAFVVYFYKSNDLIVFNLNRFQKFSNHRKCVVFLKMNTNKIHFNRKTNEMINLIIIIVFFIYRNEIVIDAI